MEQQSMLISFVKKTLLLLLFLSCAPPARLDRRPAVNQRTFTIDNDQFYKDGIPFRILGGSLHYFRIHPKYWEDRLLRVKALGLNVVQTYVPWNLHQPQADRLDFEKNTTADLEEFLKLAQRLDLLVMLRPGPYICGEWDFGGFPAWLLAVEPPLRLRTSDTKYLSLVDSWWDILLPKICPFLYSEGGPIIMLQIENEYGSFGADELYMNHLAAKARTHLRNVILYTTDGAVLENLQHGSLRRDNVYTSVDFPIEWDAAEAFQLQKRFNPLGKSPPLSSEFYTGWLTHWGEPLAQTDPNYTATALERLLHLNGSVVLYMVHGGTNFGFTSGANTGATAHDFQPDITSYDYDAPIGEAGNCGSKFEALRAVLSKHSSALLPDPPPLPKRKAYGTVELQKLSTLFGLLEYISVHHPNGITMDQPIPMEKLGQVSGFILYRSTLPAYTKSGSKLLIPEVHDRAQVFVVPLPATGSEATLLKTMHIGTLERWSSPILQLSVAAAVPGLQLDILVENMGRVNYGPFIYDYKGIASGVFLDGLPILGWTAYPIPLENIQDMFSGLVLHQPHLEQETKLVEFRRHPVAARDWTTEGPSFYKGLLDVNEPADTFVSLRGWSKGVIFINGFNLGRYWPTRGPQCTLYVPAPLLLTGPNELIILELEQPREDNVVDFSEDCDFSCGPSLNW